MARRRDVHGDDRTPLLAEEGSLEDSIKLKKASKAYVKKDISDSDWDPKLPYGGKVYLPRKKLEDPLWIKIAEALLIIGTISFGLYAYFYFDQFHFHVTNGYAHLGFAAAQHQVGQRHLNGVGTEKNVHKAMEWFKKAADQGHAHASYNLAVGHLKGLRTDLLKKGEPHTLIQHAAKEGVEEAHRVLNDICSRGHCD